MRDRLLHLNVLVDLVQEKNSILWYRKIITKLQWLVYIHTCLKKRKDICFNIIKSTFYSSISNEISQKPSKDGSKSKIVSSCYIFTYSYFFPIVLVFRSVRTPVIMIEHFFNADDDVGVFFDQLTLSLEFRKWVVVLFVPSNIPSCISNRISTNKIINKNLYFSILQGIWFLIVLKKKMKMIINRCRCQIFSRLIFLSHSIHMHSVVHIQTSHN
jgi:hypothetical protein